MKKNSQLAKDLYELYCSTSLSQPVSFQDWWTNKESYDTDYSRRMLEDDVPGCKG